MIPLFVPTAILLLSVLSVCAATLCHGLRRELNPTRRRDLTLASADKPEELQYRLRKAIWTSMTVAGTILVAGFLLSLGMSLLPLVGRHVPLWWKVIFHAYVALLPALPVGGGIIAAYACHACQTNRRLSLWTEVVAVLVSAPMICIFPLTFWGFLKFLENLPARHPTFATVAGTGGLFLLILLSVGLVIGLPSYFFGRFLSAYPYRE